MAMGVGDEGKVSLEELPVSQPQSPEDLATSLGLAFSSATSITYGPDFAPPVNLTCGLIMVPHGKTPSNEKHLFQNHADGPLSQLLDEGVQAAEKGAAAFVEEHGPAMRKSLEDWIFYRSPLTRTRDTAAPYLTALREAGITAPEPIIDPELIEITHGSWAESSVEDLKRNGSIEDGALAEQYRSGSVVAKAVDGSGESLLEVVARTGEWLRKLEARHGSGQTNVVVFGHGTFQNSVELLLRIYPEKEPAQLFSRVGGGNLKRGYAHVIAAPVVTLP